MLVLISLVALGGINVIATGEIDVSGINGKEIKDAYNDLNVQLVKDVPACGIDETMKAVKDYLSENVDRKSTFSNSELTKGSPKVNEAYRLFGALSQLDNGDRCDASAINILKQNDLASERRSHSNLGRRECRKRVETVLLHYATKSTQECPRVHADLMRQKLENFDQREFRYLDKLTERVISMYLDHFKQAGVNRADSVVKLAFHSEKMMSSLIQDFRYRLEAVLDKFAPDQKKYLSPIDDESTGLVRIDEAKIEELFNEYGIGPCKNYVTTFGPDVFEPEIYLSSYKHEPVEGDEEFYLNWTRYNMCKVFIQNEKRLLESVKFGASI